MKSSISFACLMVAGLLTAACGVDPQADCLNGCEAAKSEGCADPSTDCGDICADAVADYEDARGNAITAGCLAEFDTLYACLTGAPACSTDPCDTESGAYVDCFVEFCTANPDSEACAP